MKKLVLIVEDEEDLRELLAYHLSKEGFHAACAASGEEALQVASKKVPDLILLDLMLPGIDGAVVCRQLRSSPQTANVPIIMVTAKSEEADIVRGLNLGATDYVTKPFSPRVLMARVHAALRHAPSAAQDVEEDEEDDEVIEVHELRIHTGRHEVRVDGTVVALSFTEFRLLHVLASQPGWVFSRQQILDGIHGDTYAITERSVDVQVVNLRRKLGVAGRHIETVRGVGYRCRE